MSFLFSEVENSALLKKAQLYGAKEFVRVKVSPTAAKQLPFPSDYKYPECVLPKKFVTIADRIENFKVRPDDVWVVTFPKSGTTWVQNIIWQMINHLDFSTDYKNYRFLSTEGAIWADTTTDNINDDEFKKRIEERDRILDEKELQPSPRLLKSHLPAHLLPKNIWTVQPKIIYVYRDLKDAAVSLYHMMTNFSFARFSGTIEDFFDIILNDHFMFCPYYGHTDSYQQLSEREHILLLSYEEMLADTFAAIKKINQFLNFTYSDDQLQQLTEHVSFKNMHQHNNVDRNFFPTGFNFFRKGEAGGYRSEMSPEYIQKFDELKRQYDAKNDKTS